MRRWAGLFLGGLIVAAVTGCNGGDDGDLPAFGGAADSSASATAIESPVPTVDAKGPLAAVGDKLGDTKNAITVGRTVRGDAEKEAAQQAYLAFWALRATSLSRVEVDRAALDAVATGPAAAGVVESVRELESKKQHTEGGSTVNVQTVTVTGTTAKITDCFQDRSVDFSADGKPQDVPDLSVVPFGAELVKAGGGWRVSQLSRTKIKNCKG